MKKVFDDETARFLGYQKYWPERSDWIKYAAIVLIATAIVVGIIMTMIGIIKGFDFEVPAYTVQSAEGIYFTKSVEEKDGCVYFDNTKICGSYSITKNQIK